LPALTQINLERPVSSEVVGVDLEASDSNTLQQFSVLAASGSAEDRNVGVRVHTVLDDVAQESDYNWLEGLWIESGLQWQAPEDSLTPPDAPYDTMSDSIQHSTALEFEGGNHNALVSSHLFARSYGVNASSIGLSLLGTPSNLPSGQPVQPPSDHPVQLAIFGVKSHPYALQGEAIGVLDEHNAKFVVEAEDKSLNILKGRTVPVSPDKTRSLFVDAKALIEATARPYWWKSIGDLDLAPARLSAPEAIIDSDEPGGVIKLSATSETPVVLNFYSTRPPIPDPALHGNIPITPLPRPTSSSTPADQSLVFTVQPRTASLVAPDSQLKFEPYRLRLTFDPEILPEQPTPAIEIFPEILRGQLGMDRETSVAACPALVQPFYLRRE
jgi:hypothetical protein